MNQSLSAFPKRSLTLQPLLKGKASLIWTALAALMFISIYVANVVFVVPSLIDDIVHGSAPPASHGTLVNGKCQSRLITICDLDIAYGVGTRELTKSLHFLTLLSTPDDERPLVLFADPNAPEHVSSNWGRDLVLNRVGMQLALLGFIAFVIIAPFRAAKTRKNEEIGRVSIGATPVPVIVTIKSSAAAKGYYVVTYMWTKAAGTVTKAHTSFPTGTEPFWLDAEHKTALALSDGGDHVTLLDSGLAVLPSLTAEERAAIRARFVQ